jgi:molybdopterin-guanine dinucleotide biosynthesis protein MobB
MTKIPAISIMGWSGSGKTTLIEKLIPILHDHGLRIGVLKHDGHHFDMDREGKDTWRFAQAGAEVVAISSPCQAAVLEYRRLELPEMLDRIRGVDLILVEGYKFSELLRIEVHRQANGKPLFEDPANLLALVTDAPIVTSTPVFGLEDTRSLAEMIVRVTSIEE